MVVSSNFLLSQLADVLDVDVDEIDLSNGFVTNGGDSLNAVTVASRLKKAGHPCTVHQILTCTCLKTLIDTSPASSAIKQRDSAVGNNSDQSHVQTNTAALPLLPPTTGNADYFTTKKRKPAILKTAILKPAQDAMNKRHLRNVKDQPAPPISDTTGLSVMQASLLYGSWKNSKTNIIYHYQTYPSELIPDLKRAWQRVLLGEPVFQKSLLHRSESEEGPPQFDWTEVLVTSRPEYQHELEQVGLDTATSVFKVVHCHIESELPKKSTIIWAVHHALIDGYSASLLFRKVRDAAAGLPITPGPSYYDVEQRIQQYRQKHLEAGRQYWKTESPRWEQARHELLLPTPVLVSGDETFSLGHDSQSAEVFIGSVMTSDQLQSAIRTMGITPATIFLGAWALVLSEFANSDNVMFGTVFSGRGIPVAGIDEAIGPFVNTLPLSVSLNPDATVSDFLQSLFKQILELAGYQWTTPEDGFVRSFETAVAMQVEDIWDTTGVRPIETAYTRQTTDMPLSMSILPDGAATLTYHTDRFAKRDIERVAAYYQAALRALMRPDTLIETCQQTLLSCPDLELLMDYGNCHSGATTAVSVHDDLVTLFERAQQQNPDAVAVRKGQTSMTYRELDEATGRVAASLQHLVASGEVICVHADRSINWIVAIFGVLKAKAVYCAVDHALPDEAREAIFSGSSARVFLVPSASDLAICPASCESLLSVADMLQGQLSLPARETAQPWTNAYLCFTSGSTGRPKGVMCSHEGLVAFQRDLEVRLFAQPGRRISQIMSVAFDGSIHEIFSALCYGATLVLHSGDGPFSHLGAVDAAILTPSMARALDPSDYPELDTVYLVGEPVTPEVRDRWASCVKLYNMYGPTEGTGGATIKRLHPDQKVNIGTPNPSTRIYILNRKRRLVPPGAIGEIYLAGVQVARHYIGMPKETAERFTLDPIRRIGESMYKTGDLGYWNTNGEIVCLGRTDRQIKLRGFRLDLDDLEVRMTRAAPVVTAVAIIRQDNHLVAAVLPRDADLEDFRARIAQVLPSYAIPRQIFALDTFPTTKVGKLDYKALDEFSREAAKIPRRPIRSATEKLVAAAFRDVLQLDCQEEVTALSSFRDLGGHSLVQLQLVNRLRHDLGIQISLRLVAQYDTVADLAKAIDGITEAEPLAAVQIKALGDSRLSPPEMEYWRKYQVREGLACFNVAFVAALSPALVSYPKLTKACNEVLARHSILSSRFVFQEKIGKPVRVISSHAPLVQRVENADVRAEVNRPFLLSESAPIRILLSHGHLIITISHTVADLTTLQILLREINACYTGGYLPRPLRTYMACTSWNEEVSEDSKDFWSEYLHDPPSTQHLVGHASSRTGYQGTSAVCEIPGSVYSAMRTFLSQNTISAQQLALAAVALCLNRSDAPIPDSTDIVLGIPYINRNCVEDMDVVGLFLEPLPVRVRYNGARQCQTESYLEAIQRSVQAAVSHAMPWDALLRHLGISSQPPDHPLFETVVTFHHRNHSHGLDLAIPGTEACYTFAQGAKFKLLCEFSAVSSDTLLLRVEHDHSCLTPDQVRLLQQRIPLALMLLIEGASPDVVTRSIADPVMAPSVRVLAPEDLIGIPLSRIGSVG